MPEERKARATERPNLESNSTTMETEDSKDEGNNTYERHYTEDKSTNVIDVRVATYTSYKSNCKAVK